MVKSVVTHNYKEAAIDKAIASVGKDAASLQQKIHNLGASVLMIWRSAKDDVDAAKLAVDRLNTLSQMSPYHRNNFNKWVALLPNVEWSSETDTFYIHIDNARLSGKDFVALRDNPFWKVAPPKVQNPYDMFDQWDKFFSGAEKKVQNPKDGDVVDLEIMRLARDLNKAIDAKRQAA
tara:strand:- start:5288 stop:5818 length:531 start_codon:yes stop_codon:yes gene_type:complete